MSSTAFVTIWVPSAYLQADQAQQTHSMHQGGSVCAPGWLAAAVGSRLQAKARPRARSVHAPVATPRQALLLAAAQAAAGLGDALVEALVPHRLQQGRHEDEGRVIKAARPPPPAAPRPPPHTAIHPPTQASTTIIIT